MLDTLPLQAAINNTTDIYNLLNSAANWFYAFLLILAVIGILYGAFSYVTAGGDSEKMTTARWIVIGSLIGAAIATLSRSMIAILQKVFQ